MTVNLFVYGTLKSGFPNNLLLKGQRFLRPVRTLPRYCLFDAGAYPCLVEDREQGQEVLGELWEVEGSILPRLDEYEGAPHLFERQAIRLRDITSSAIAYFYLGPTRHLPVCQGAWPATSP